MRVTSQLNLMILSFISLIYCQCTNPIVRKEIRDLTSEEFYRLTSAIRTLQTTPSNITGLSIHEWYSKLHNDNHLEIHNKPRFLPWHRRFIREYERELQKIDPKVYLPFWDWSIDGEHPERSIVLSYLYYGSNGAASEDYCVIDGEFAYMEMNYVNRHCLQRSYNKGSTISKFTVPEVINPYLNIKKFSEFEDKIEFIHGHPHDNIGGKFDFGQMFSPNDPLFYIHHSFIDMLWWNWQQKNPNVNQYDGDAYGVRGLTSKDTLITWKENVASTLNTKSPYYCYVYPSYPTNLNTAAKANSRRAYSPYDPTTSISNLLPITTFGSNDAGFTSINNVVSNITVTPQISSIMNNNPILSGLSANLTLPQLIQKLSQQNSNPADKPTALKQFELSKLEPLSEAWIKMNNMDIVRVRQNEAIINRYVDLLNSLPNFISLAYKPKPIPGLLKGRV